MASNWLRIHLPTASNRSSCLVQLSSNVAIGAPHRWPGPRRDHRRRPRPSSSLRELHRRRSAAPRSHQTPLDALEPWSSSRTKHQELQSGQPRSGYCEGDGERDVLVGWWPPKSAPSSARWWATAESQRGGRSPARSRCTRAARVSGGAGQEATGPGRPSAASLSAACGRAPEHRHDWAVGDQRSFARPPSICSRSRRARASELHRRRAASTNEQEHSDGECSQRHHRADPGQDSIGMSLIELCPQRFAIVF